MRHLLTHSAGLKPWRGFHELLIEKERKTGERLIGTPEGAGLDHRPRAALGPRPRAGRGRGLRRPRLHRARRARRRAVPAAPRRLLRAAHLRAASACPTPASCRCRSMAGRRPLPELRRRVAATENCPWRERVLWGEVHDPERLGDGRRRGPRRALLDGGRRACASRRRLLDVWHGAQRRPPARARARVPRQRQQPADSDWALGWDTPTAGSFVVGPALLGALGRTPRLHGHVALDRSRARGDRGDADESGASWSPKRSRFELRPQVHDADHRRLHGRMRPNARALRHVHFIAIGGTGMGSLAGLLKARGIRVTGSDATLYPPMSTALARLGHRRCARASRRSTCSQRRPGPRRDRQRRARGQSRGARGDRSGHPVPLVLGCALRARRCAASRGWWSRGPTARPRPRPVRLAAARDRARSLVAGRRHHARLRRLLPRRARRRTSSSRATSTTRPSSTRLRSSCTTTRDTLILTVGRVRPRRHLPRPRAREVGLPRADRRHAPRRHHRGGLEHARTCARWSPSSLSGRRATRPTARRPVAIATGSRAMLVSDAGGTSFELCSPGVRSLALRLPCTAASTSRMAWLRWRRWTGSACRLRERRRGCRLPRREAPPGAARGSRAASACSTTSPIIPPPCAPRSRRCARAIPGRRTFAVFEPRTNTSRRRHLPTGLRRCARRGEPMSSRRGPDEPIYSATGEVTELFSAQELRRALRARGAPPTRSGRPLDRLPPGSPSTGRATSHSS